MADRILLVSSLWADGSNLCDREEKGTSNKLLSWQEHPVYALRNTMALHQDVAIWLQKTACKNLWTSALGTYTAQLFSEFFEHSVYCSLEEWRVNCMLCENKHILCFFFVIYLYIFWNNCSFSRSTNAICSRTVKKRIKTDTTELFFSCCARWLGIPQFIVVGQLLKHNGDLREN